MRFLIITATLVLFSGKSYAQDFGVNVVNGIEVYASSNSKVFGNRDFLSSQSLCSGWREKQGQLEQALVSASAAVNPSLPKGVSIVRQTFTISQDCNAVANYAAGTIIVNLTLPDNVFTFNVTTPGILPQSTDPRISVHFATRGSTQIRIQPRASVSLDPIKVTIFNIEPRGENITGDIAVAAAKLVSNIASQDFLAELTRSRTFEFNGISGAVGSVNNALNTVAAGAPSIEQIYDPSPKLVILRAAGREVSFKSVNFGDRYIRHRNSLGFLEPVPYTDFLGQKDATFNIVPGLAGKCSSFESYNFPGQFLRHQSTRLKLSPRSNDQLFREDATFCLVQGLAGSGSSFESVNYPGQYIRHRNFELWLARFDGTDQFRKDATFERVPALVTTGSVVR
ncbi:MAG TPA: AbfB domain-containing protein [Gemmatimonadaceae bacterium]|nr:AbfB domain-containing protein [Gemmatimonadaceae bacterium]